MSGYMPTTEQVRDGYRYDPEAEYHDPITPHHVTNGRAFDRWHAAEIAAAKAEALREAAEWSWENVFISMDSRDIYEHLLTRADQIERTTDER